MQKFVQEFVLRDYRPEDFDALHALDQNCFDPAIAYSRDEMRFFLDRETAFTIVAEQSGPAPGPPAGFIIADRHPRHIGHIITIDVAESARRAGLGSLLLTTAEARIRRQDVSLMLLEVAVNNTAAQRFYERHGYELMKRLPKYYDGRIDGLLLGKALMT